MANQGYGHIDHRSKTGQETWDGRPLADLHRGVHALCCCPAQLFLAGNPRLASRDASRSRQLRLFPGSTQTTQFDLRRQRRTRPGEVSAIALREQNAGGPQSAPFQSLAEPRGGQVRGRKQTGSFGLLADARGHPANEGRNGGDSRRPATRSTHFVANIAWGICLTHKWCHAKPVQIHSGSDLDWRGAPDISPGAIPSRAHLPGGDQVATINHPLAPDRRPQTIGPA